MAKVAGICEEFAQETTISGLYFIAKYKAISLKILWIFIVVGLFVANGWQCYLCFVKYFNRPTIVVTKLFYHPLKFPAVTFCNVNPYIRERVEQSNSSLKDLEADLNQALYGTSEENKRLKRQISNNEPCPINWVRVGSSCYLKTDITQSWNDSLEYCSKRNSSLPIFYNASEYILFTDWWNSRTDSSEVWLGITYDPGKREWLWINNCPWKHYPSFWRTCWHSSCQFQPPLQTTQYFAKYSNNRHSPFAVTGVEPVPVIKHESEIQTVCYQPIAKQSKSSCYEFPIDIKSFLCNSDQWWCASENLHIPLVVNSVIEANSCFCLTYNKEELVVGEESCDHVGGFLADIRTDSEQNLLQYLVDLLDVQEIIPASTCPEQFSYYNGSCFAIFNANKLVATIHPLSKSANIFCQNLYDANAISVHSFDEQWFLNYLYLSTVGFKWLDFLLLGAYCNFSRASCDWHWWDGSAVDYMPEFGLWNYQNFEPNTVTPNDNLVIMPDNGMLGDYNVPVTFGCRKHIPKESIQSIYPVLFSKDGKYVLLSSDKTVSSVDRSTINTTVHSFMCRKDRNTNSNVSNTNTTENDNYATISSTNANVVSASPPVATDVRIEPTQNTSLNNNAEPPLTIKGDQIHMVTEAQEKLLYTASEMKFDYLSTLSYSLKDLMSHCSFNGTPCRTEHFQQSFYPSAGNCFTYNYNQLLSLSRNGATYGLFLVLDLNVSTYTLSSLTSGFLLIVHGQNETIFPDNEALRVAAGYHADISLLLQTVTTLPAPYGDCIDTTVTKNANYSVEACYRMCQQKAVLLMCKCGDPSLPLPDSVKFCSWSQRNCVAEASNSTLTVDDCSCPTVCQSKNYKLTTTFSKIFSKSEENELANGSSRITNQNSAVIKIFYQRLNYVAYNEQSSYDKLALMSDIANYLGLWLGFSAVTFFELIPFCLLIIAALYHK